MDNLKVGDILVASDITIYDKYFVIIDSFTKTGNPRVCWIESTKTLTSKAPMNESYGVKPIIPCKRLSKPYCIRKTKNGYKHKNYTFSMYDPFKIYYIDHYY